MTQDVSTISDKFTERARIAQAVEVGVVEANNIEDRRDGQRLHTAYRVARVRAGSVEKLARVLSISDGGMRLSIRIDVPVGDIVEVNLSNTLALNCRVLWNKDDECRLKFVKWVDKIAVLHAATEVVFLN